MEYDFINHDSSAGESLKRVIDEKDVTWDKSFEGHSCPSDFARELERELAESREECAEQARLLGMSGEREAALLANVERLERERENWRLSSVCRELAEQRDRLQEALGRLVSFRNCPRAIGLAQDTLTAIKAKETP